MARVPATQRRREFVEATVRVIAEHGVPGATTRRIAEAAGAPLASLHYCFHTKEDLFVAVFEEQALRLAGRRMEEGDGRDGLTSAATRNLEGCVGWFRDNPDWARAQVELLFWALRQDDDLATATRSYEVHHEKLVADLRAWSNPDDDQSMIEPVARMIAATADGLLLQWFAYGDDMLAAGLKTASEALGLFIEQSRRTTGRD